MNLAILFHKLFVDIIHHRITLGIPNMLLHYILGVRSPSVIDYRHTGYGHSLRTPLHTLPCPVESNCSVVYGVACG